MRWTCCCGVSDKAGNCGSFHFWGRVSPLSTRVPDRVPNMTDCIITELFVAGISKSRSPVAEFHRRTPPSSDVVARMRLSGLNARDVTAWPFGENWRMNRRLAAFQSRTVWS
jgi:hypothetical protein